MWSQVQPRPRKFPFRPELGAALSRGALVLAPGTPEGAGRGRGRALGYLETPCQFLSMEGTPPLRPAPHPTPREPSRGCKLQPTSPEPLGLERGPSLPVRKSFQGIFPPFSLIS